MRKFKINPLVLAIAVSLPAPAVMAQDDTIEEVIVTGSFRESLATSLNIKRNSAGAVDAIVASDIAEFPDNNLAESMQRIPGVAISRVGGEGRNITVRGLGPLFTRVRVNGMESVSTTGSTDAAGGNNRNRVFDFNTFSSDLFSSLTVRKTGSAETQEGSLGATVDLKAAQPFDFDGFVLTASGQLGYNDLSEKTDPSASVLISNIFADGKFGALFSLSYADRTVRDEGSSTVRWSNNGTQNFGSVQGLTHGALGPLTEGVATNPNAFDLVNGPCVLNAAQTSCTYPDRKFTPRIPRYDSYTHELERLGASASFQFRPTDVTEISLDVLYSKHDATRQEIFMQGSLNPGRNSVSNVTDFEIIGDTLSYTQIQNARLITENRFDELTTDFLQYTLSFKHEFTDRFRMDAMVGKSESDHKNPVQNTLMMLANGIDFSYDYRERGNPSLIFGNAAYNPASWGVPTSASDQTYAAVRNRPQNSLNEYDTIQANFAFDINDSLTLKAGVESREFAMETNQFVPAAGEGARSIDLHSNPDFIMEYNSGLGDGRAWLIPNRALIMESYGFFDSPMNPNYANTWSVSEETLGYYVQLDFSTEIGSVPVRGDIGVRNFTTDQTSSGWSNANNAARALTTVEHDYSDTLPSFNLVVEPVDNFLIRLGFSEGISRPGLQQITPVVNTTVAGTNKTVTGNNPFLEPTKAKSYDLGFEWYFADEGMISLALFKKEIESHIQTLRTTPIFTEIGLPTQLVIDACTVQGASLGGYGPDCNENQQWNYSVAANGPGGDLDGFEISYQQPFTFLPGIWSNFGFIGSYTQVESEMDYLNADGVVQATRPLNGLSENTSSATLYYEGDTFSGRVSVASRSGYLTNPIGRDGNDMEGTRGTTNVDASFGYQLNDNIKFTLEALNLTDEADDQWVGQADKRLSYYHTTGRQYYLGVQYKY